MLKLSRIILLLVILSLNGCFSIKSSYPEIEYYKFTQEKSSLNNFGKMEGLLEVRDFKASADIQAPNLVAIWDNQKVQLYYYHRWLTDVWLMVSDFLINRYNNYQAFSKGVIKSSIYSRPDYVLEGQILELYAFNSSDEDENPNYAFISLQINLIKMDKALEEGKIILSKVYKSQIPRKDDKVKSMAAAYSLALSDIADRLLIDIQMAIVSN